LRRSLGVSLTAKGQVHIRPAPPTAIGPIDEEGVGGMGGDEFDFSNQEGKEALGGADWMDWSQMKAQMGQEGHGEL